MQNIKLVLRNMLNLPDMQIQYCKKVFELELIVFFRYQSLLLL